MQIAAHARDGLWLLRRHMPASVARQAPQEGTQILTPALAEKGEERRELVGRQSRSLVQPLVVAVFAGKHSERDAALARYGRERIDAVAPPIESTEQPHHNHFGASPDLVDP